MSIKNTSKLFSSMYTIKTRCILKSCRRRIHLSTVRDDELKNYITKAVGSVGNKTQIFCDKPDDIKLSLKTLTGTDQVLREAARSNILNNDNSSYELIVLLLSKAAGVQVGFKDDEYDHGAGILQSQKVVAESVVMLRTSQILHNMVTNSKTQHYSARCGNAIMLLSGDHLLSTVLNEIIRLKNDEVTELLSSSIRDSAESQFIGSTTSENEPIPCKPRPESQFTPVPFEFSSDPIPFKNALGNAKSEWMLRNILSSATFLAKGCQSSLILAGHSQVVQRKAHVFGRNLALTWQASRELRQFSSNGPAEFSLIAAPILFHLQHHPEFYSEFEQLEDSDVSVAYGKIKEVVRSGPGIEKTLEMKTELARGCLDALDDFKPSAAKDVLVRLIESL